MDRCEFSHGATSDFPIFATFDSCVPPTVDAAPKNWKKSPPLSFLKERKVRQTSHSGQKYISGSPQENKWRTSVSGTFSVFNRSGLLLKQEAGAWAIFRHFLLEETSSEWVQWCGHWKSYLTTNQRNGHADLASRWLCNTQNKFLFCKLHVWCWQHDDHCCHFLCWPVIYGHWATSRYNSLTFAPSFQVPPPIGFWLEPSVPLPISWSVVNRSASP